METPSESRILRLAIARGLLSWEDVEAVAARLPEPADPSQGAEEAWLEALLAEGRIAPAALRALAAELRQESGDQTPDLHVRNWPWSRREPLRSSQRNPERNGLLPPLPQLPPEHAFLASWDRYRVERLLGAGGMGTVYKAADPALGRPVALKFLHRNDLAHTERFLREARAQARINHPGICPVHEVGEVEGRPYIAMRYVEGRSLAEMREELSVESLLRLMREVALAVHAAHKMGLIHRDLKPANVLVEATDSGGLHPFVLDFGLAQDQEEQGLTHTGMVTGTPAYLSPEQAQAKTLDRRSDVYSLGVMLYELLSGRTPFTAPNPAAILIRLVQDEPEPLRKLVPSLPQDLETLVMKCLEKDPAQRYDSARALAEDIARYLDGEPIQARPAGWAYRMGKKIRKHRALAVAVAGAVSALLVMGALSLWAQWQARERALLAQEFGRRVGELESGLRLEAFQPLHDTTRRKARIRREIAEIQAEMRRLGKPAEGPGHYALGRAYLALHHYEQAADHLERAWKAGQQDPEVAAALGRAFGFLYENALLGADRSQESARRAARAEIERIFGGPALSYLRQALQEDTLQEDSRPQQYLAALVAFYEGRYPEVVERSRQAAREQIGLYEATQLEAEAFAAQGDQAADAGDYEAAFRFYDQAGEVYRGLLQRVPSDASLHAGECSRQARQIETEVLALRYREEAIAEALKVCARALEVDPELSEALVQKARLYRRRGVQKAGRGEDPGADLAAGAAAAERAVALEPRNSLAYNSLAVLLRVQGIWERGQGRNSSPTLQRAAVAARKAVELQPGRASSHNDLCTIYVDLAGPGGRNDPVALEKAIASCNEAVRLDPGYLPAHTNLGSAWKTLAERQMASGQDPSRALGFAVTASERAVRLNPNRAPFHNNVGNAYLTTAEYQMSRGLDPRAALGKAAAAYRRSIAVHPDYQLGAFNLAWAERNLALALLERGEDPGPALAKATEAIATAIRLLPDDADSFVERARIEMVAGRWAARQGQDFEPAFRTAEAALRRAAEINPNQLDLSACRALLERHRAEARGSARR